MLFTKKTCLLAAAFLLATPTLAIAHPGHGGEGGFGSGLLHPLTGVDHLLAMMAVALLAVRIGGRSLWAVPTAFIASGVLGGVLAWTGTSLPMVEAMIIGSVLVVGFLLARRRDVPTIACAVIPLFGLFHGYAHVNEMSSMASVASYSAGLAITSSATIAGTILIAMLVKTYRSEQAISSVYRFLGSGFCAAAVIMIVGQLA